MRTTEYARWRRKGDDFEESGKEKPDSREGAGFPVSRQAAAISGWFAFRWVTSLRIDRARISQVFIATVTMSPPLTCTSRSIRCCGVRPRRSRDRLRRRHGQPRRDGPRRSPGVNQCETAIHRSPWASTRSWSPTTGRRGLRAPPAAGRDSRRALRGSGRRAPPSLVLSFSLCCSSVFVPFLVSGSVVPSPKNRNYEPETERAKRSLRDFSLAAPCTWA
jgi:hypothetical protein